VVNNLYGVDIMAEAVEIARLRFFLKLAAQVDRVEDIEPLPDIDFNIRAGNTLVGFTTVAEVERAMKIAQSGQRKLMFGEDVATLQRIEEKAQDVNRLFGEFQAMQTAHDMREYAQDFMETKEELRKRLQALEDELNRYLAQEYGVDVTKPAAYQKWLASHQPFHWFTEFYGILKQGGFDVIIGNPPYVEYSKVKRFYTVKGYLTDSCSNLYPFVVERSYKLLSRDGLLSMILPLSAFCTRRMGPLVETVKKSATVNWVSHFGWRPAKLFDGVNIPLSILISQQRGPNADRAVYTTEFTKWYQEKRPSVFPILQYANSTQFLHFDFIVPKVAPEMVPILAKVFEEVKRIESYSSPIKTPHVLFYRNTGGLYWRIMTDFPPFFARNGVRSQSSTESTLFFQSGDALALSLALLNSNFFWLFYVVFSIGLWTNHR
jgi:cell fate (sporulation/competence/biofilm development) regulator YlbF (YheA/YmcA/DUF963 family)